MVYMGSKTLRRGNSTNCQQLGSFKMTCTIGLLLTEIPEDSFLRLKISDQCILRLACKLV